MSGPLMLLTRNADFRRMLGAELIMFGGDWFVMVPLLVLLQQLTGSGVWGGLMLAVDTGCMALLLPYTGTLADRLDRKKIVLWANAVSILAVLLLLLVRSPGMAWLALVAMGSIAVAKAFYSPAAQAALPNLLAPEDLPAASVLTGSSWGTMAVLGASLGGMSSAAFGPYWSFVGGALCLAMAITLQLRVRQPFQAARSTVAVSAWSALRESMGYLRVKPRVRALITVKCAVGVGNGVLAVFPVLAATVFHVGPLGVGALFAARGLGALFGPLLLRGVVLRRQSWLLPGLAVSMATYGVAYLMVGLTPWFWLALVLVAVAHMAGGGNWAMSSLALQLEVPDKLRGRVFSADVMIAFLAVSLSQGTAGVLSDHVPARVIVAVGGALTLAYSICWYLATARLRRAQPATA
ncbi:MFS transporter [Longispora fulva]|uniref:MFS family permease n=1 Tax=Longispora fulva TaxID=619741 RepID=A0A8J7KMR6_9ACTN|nr:MFS transporter [Longispora fulva]MBG6140809.1 MFS family permease [Longispora fulva]GIG60927.1 MFS transporter [Longispora fulva]